MSIVEDCRLEIITAPNAQTIYINQAKKGAQMSNPIITFALNNGGLVEVKKIKDVVKLTSEIIKCKTNNKRKVVV